VEEGITRQIYERVEEIKAEVEGKERLIRELNRRLTGRRG
jgi:predicted PP-loop superfamily ATPase